MFCLEPAKEEPGFSIGKEVSMQLWKLQHGKVWMPEWHISVDSKYLAQVEQSQGIVTTKKWHGIWFYQTTGFVWHGSIAG